MKWLKYILITGIFLILITGGIMMFSKTSMTELIGERNKGFVMGVGEELILTKSTEFGVKHNIPINFSIYNQDGYNYKSEGTSYDFYVKSASNWGDGTKFCSDITINDSEIEKCLIYQPQDMSYRNRDGSQDYISSLQYSEGQVINESIFYKNIFPNVDLNYSLSFDNVKEIYTLNSKPKIPATYLGDNVTLDFGGYIKYGDLEIWTDDLKQTGNFVTSEQINFKYENETFFYLPKPYAWDSNGVEINLQYEVKVQGNQIWFYVRTPYDFIKDAVYPVYIDPTIQFGAGGDVESPVSTPLTDNTFALAWCDETADDIYLQFFNTTGENYTGVITVDANVGSCNRFSVTISSFNSTSLVIGYYDAAQTDTSFVVYDNNGNVMTSKQDATTNAGGDYGISVSTLSSNTFVIAWYDSAQSDHTFSTYYSNGTLIAGPIDADTTSGSLISGVSTTSLNSTLFAISWKDGGSYIISFATYDIYGTNINGPFTVASVAAFGSHALSMTSLAVDKLIIAWHNSPAGERRVVFKSYYTNGTNITEQIIVEGADSSSLTDVSVSALSSNTFVIGYFNDGTNKNSIRIYYFNGTDITGVIDSGLGTNNYGHQSISHSNIVTDISLCDNNFIHTFAKNSTNAYWISYYSNGTIWDGNCGAEGPAPPVSSCASLVGNTWYVPKGCQCYCDSSADGQLNLSKCSCVSV